MSKFLGNAVLVIVLAGGAGAAHARTLVSSLEVRTNRPASVFIDGEARGKAPLTITGIPPGAHNVKIVDDSTGFARDKPFVAPYDRALDQVVNIEFQGGTVLNQAPLSSVQRFAQERQAQVQQPAIPEVVAPPTAAVEQVPLRATYVPYSTYAPNTNYDPYYYDDPYYANGYYGYPYYGSGYYTGFGVGFGRDFRRHRGFRSGGFSGVRSSAFSGRSFGSSGFRSNSFRSSGFRSASVRSSGSRSSGGSRGGGRRR